MKKILCVLLCLLFAFGPTTCLAEKKQIFKGYYIVGEDIEPGSYIITVEKNENEEKRVDFFIYPNKEDMLAFADTDFRITIWQGESGHMRLEEGNAVQFMPDTTTITYIELEDPDKTE